MPKHRGEPLHHRPDGRIHPLRIAVLGVDAGIVSTAGLVTGVAGATADRRTTLVVGLAGLVLGALAMAAVHLSAAARRGAVGGLPEAEFAGAAAPHGERLVERPGVYRGKGLRRSVPRRGGGDGTAALAGSRRAGFLQGPGSVRRTAGLSVLAYVSGASLPLGVVLLAGPARVLACFATVPAGLALTGAVSRHLGGSHRGSTVLRTVLVTALVMAVTYGIGVGVDALA